MAKKILIIDDEEQVCALVKTILERTGEFEVSVAFRGDHGLEKARAEHPDLVLLDIVMPGIGGNEVAEQLLQGPSTRDIPIIFLSALAQKNEVDSSGGRIGGREFMAKPVQPDELIQRVRQVLGPA